MEKTKKTLSAEELLRRIQELEVLHTRLKQQISKLMHQKPDHQICNSACSHLRAIGGPSVDLDHGGLKEPFDMKLTETRCLNILQSMGQAVHIFDHKHRIYLWNRTAEEIYGYTPAEVFGKTPTEILVDPKDAAVADYLLERTVNGESWSGKFPITNNRGETFVVVSTNTPFRDENGRLVGGICVSSDSRLYRFVKPKTGAMMIDSLQLGQTSIASKISNLASKVKLKMQTDHAGWCADHSDYATQIEASTPRGHIDPSPFGVFLSTGTEDNFPGKFTISSVDKTENKHGISKMLSSKAEEWMGKRRSLWPWKGDERKDVSLEAKLDQFGWQRLHVLQEHEPSPQAKFDCQQWENNFGSKKMEASGGLLSTLRENSTSSSSSGSTSINSNAIIKVENERESLDYEILWEDLIIKRQIGQGSCGTVYHGMWYGSDVAVKLFTYQDHLDNVMVSFRQEVSFMKRLRHPNILLFMGAVTSPQHLCIVTEFLPRGSLFRILKGKPTQLDWRRRLHMAMDIARGMNYLHHHNPPIVHRDLKSSNLLVDKNWTVKVGDFGLSRIKHQTYLKTNSGKGTPQWMAPELLRNEQADEKSDVYSYGVVVWEIITGKIPWDDLHPMQVIGAVGFMNQRLEIPKNVDPLWASLIDSCWRSEPQSRPTFQEILYKLKELQKKFAIERRR